MPDVINHSTRPLTPRAAEFLAWAERQDTIRVSREIGGTVCPGAFDDLSGDYDPYQDREYHTDNPTASSCDNGIVGATTVTEDWKVFVVHDLDTQHLKHLGIGVLEDNDLVIFVPVNRSFSETSADVSGNVTHVEFPVGSGRTYRVENPNVWMFQDGPFYRYARLVVEDEGSGIGHVPGMDV